MIQLLAGDHETVGVYAINTKTGKVILDENSDKSLIPASCMKLVTTGAALHLLDPSSRFQTDLEYDGVIRDGTLYGNLYIKGGGDPCLGSAWKEQLELWVAAISKLGIRKIQGDVIGDDTRWEKAMAVPSWEWEDLGNYYGAAASALSFHENFYSVVFKPGNVGEEAKIARTEPPCPFLIFKNEMKIGSADTSCIYGSEYSFVRYIRGMIPAGTEEFSIKGSLPDPAAFCAELLSQALSTKEISIEHQQIAPTKRVSFYTIDSPSMKEIIYWVNQKSVNLYSEHLLKKMGEVVQEEGSTAAGIIAVRNFWKSQGVDLDGFNMADGSGLSRKNLITPKQLVSILQKMKQSDRFPIFLDSLPAQSDKIRAKSGSMSLIKCFAGYTGDIAFAIMINQYTDVQKMKEKIDLYLSKLTY